MDALQIIVPVFTLVLGLFIGYFLKKAEYERKRRDDSADKEQDRRIKYRDKNIENVQSYINTYLEVIRILVEFELLVINAKDVDEHLTDYEKILDLLASTAKWMQRFGGLNDSELSEANHELILYFSEEHRNSLDLAKMITDNETFDREAVTKRVLEFQYTAVAYIGVMQTRIHVLAESLE